MLFCHVTGHTSPAEALTAFGYVKMEFCGRRFPAFYYGLLTRLYYIYGISSKMFYPKSFFTLFVPVLTPAVKICVALKLQIINLLVLYYPRKITGKHNVTY